MMFTTVNEDDRTTFADRSSICVLKLPFSPRVITLFVGFQVIGRQRGAHAFPEKNYHDVAVRRRQIDRKLRSVEVLPEMEAEALLGVAPGFETEQPLVTGPFSDPVDTIAS